MHNSFNEKVQNIAREILTNLSAIDFEPSAGQKAKERFKKLLQEFKNKREVVDFLSLDNHRKYKDFLVVVIKDGKHDVIGVKIKNSARAVKRYKERQKELKMEFMKRRQKFVENFVILVNSQPNDELKKQWQKTLKQHKES